MSYVERALGVPLPSARFQVVNVTSTEQSKCESYKLDLAFHPIEMMGSQSASQF